MKKLRKIIGSSRSQRVQKEIWRLESELTKCKAQVGLWERNLAKAKEGIERQSAQLSGGVGSAHSILVSYVEERRIAEGMISAFKDNAASLRAKLDALLFPSPQDIAERVRQQEIMAGLVAARLEIDKKLDLALEAARKILFERRDLTAKMTEVAGALDFGSSVNLDHARFLDLMDTLPKEIARESAEWVSWFLGTEPDRAPHTVRGGDFCLDETLVSCNAFRSGDTPSLTEKERRELEARAAALVVPSAWEVQQAVNSPSVKPEQPTGKIQWGLGPGSIL